jgi:hypothetical protein
MGFWQAIGEWTSEPTTRHHEDSFDTEVPCKQDAFSFRVTVREVWSRPGSADDLAAAVVAQRPAHEATLRRRLRVISRRYPPQQSALVECHANDELGRPQPFGDEPGLTCACSFEVTPDETLIEHMQQAERTRLTAEASHDAVARNLERLEQVEKRWLAFLRQLSRDPLGLTIARLTGGPELADAIDRYAAQQEQATKELRDLCDTATDAYREKGLYDYAMTTDNAFSRLLEHINQGSGPSANGGGPNGHRPSPSP